jgi:hypothetical protein
MAYLVNTTVVTFRCGQFHGGAVVVAPWSEPALRAPQGSHRQRVVAVPERVHQIVVCDAHFGIHRVDQGQVIPADPPGAFRLDDPRLVALSANSYLVAAAGDPAWRSSKAMSRTSPTRGSRPLPAEARGLSGSFR